MALKSTCPTLKKIGEDEPMFVLRAQDITAPAIISSWLALNPQITLERRAEAVECIKAMNAWPNRKRAD